MDNPELYDECRKHSLKKDANALVPLLLNLQKWGTEEKILDYGCGPGSVGYEFLRPQAEKYNSSIYSVDCNESMINFAKEKYPHHRITYQVGNIMDNKKWNMGNIKFDKIFSHLVLHYIRDTEKLLQRFHANLAPSGQLAFVFVTKNVFYKCHQHFGQHIKWGKYIKDYQEYIPMVWENNLDSVEVFRKQFDKVGFSVVEIKTLLVPFNADVTTAVKLYWSLYPFSTNVPTEEHASLKRDIAAYLPRVCKMDENGNLFGEYESFYAVVEKKAEDYARSSRRRLTFPFCSIS